VPENRTARPRKSTSGKLSELTIKHIPLSSEDNQLLKFQSNFEVFVPNARGGDQSRDTLGSLERIVAAKSENKQAISKRGYD